LIFVIGVAGDSDPATSAFSDNMFSPEPEQYQDS